MSVADSPESTARGSPVDGPDEALRDAARETARQIGVASVDADNPWLGLTSFTEETRALFFGREGEVAELGRRVQRKLLTVLFGKSGLGKTSILQAGLVPGLRERGYFPVYLRIDYGHDSPEPAEQIKQAIGKAAASGGWTQSDVAVAGESIWEFLHHRDDVLKDASGATLIPLLIFDQFEELFTLAQSDEFGRARAARFVEELADLVENRPPKALEAKLEADESTAERFDFSRSDYRVVIALREDYLAPLESLKRQMPTLSQNRLRLAPMTGSQALAAVLQPGNRLRPGKPLVSEEVAEAIVRFVAGGAELANAEVEPSLLSLICRELNEQRIAQGRGEISQDLLAGSHETILSTFYERALADQPEPVRRIIEDDLLTESGYRENLAEESLLRRFQAAGAAPDALAKLVNRRLLRIEERLDVRRVELTHDVLTGVVKASRDRRHEREAREATERALAEQRERESAARRALRRARAIAAGCALLALVAIAATAAAFFSMQRARRAELAARQTRAISEQARQEADGLLGFLTDSFVNELETFGRSQTIAELTQREIDYFQHLPSQLKDPQTVRSGALALVNHAEALLELGDPVAARKNASEAVALLEQLRRNGDRSDATTVTLGRAYAERAVVFGELTQSAQVINDARKAANLLRPLAERTGASNSARRAYLGALLASPNDTGNSSSVNRLEAMIRVVQEAQRVGRELGAPDHGDIIVDEQYAGAEADLAHHLIDLGRNDEGRRAAEEALIELGRILAERPQYGEALGAQESAEQTLMRLASDELDPIEALGFATKEEQSALALVGVEPQNLYYIHKIAVSYSDLAGLMWDMGQLREAIGYDRKFMDVLGQIAAPGRPATALQLALATLVTVDRQVQLGDFSGAAATVAAGDAFLNRITLGKLGQTGRVTEWLIDRLRAITATDTEYERGNFTAARQIARSAMAGSSGQVALDQVLRQVLRDYETGADYALGDFAASAQAARTELGMAKTLLDTGDVGGQRAVASVRIWLSMALAREGKRAEAARTIGPVVQMYRALEKRNHGDQWLPLELAEALYTQSLTGGQHRAELLREAAQLVDHLIPTIARLHDTRQWRAWIEAAQRAPDGQAAQ